MLFRGAGVAMCTPFTKDGINFDTFEKQIEFQIKGGSDALIVCGTTGEPATMTKEERNSLIKFAVDKTAGRVPVIAGVGGNNTANVVASAQAAEEFGADGLLVVTPYYNKCSRNGLIAHFETVADNTKLPIIVYNVPSRTTINITPEVFERLCEHRRIVGIKEASGDIAQVIGMVRVAEMSENHQVDVLSGNDDMVVPLLSVGGVGVISVLANIMPKYMHDMTISFLDGDANTAREMQVAIYPLIRALFTEVNPIPVKAAMKLMGFDMGELRLPLCDIERGNLNELKSEMRKFDLID